MSRKDDMGKGILSLSMLSVDGDWLIEVIGTKNMFGEPSFIEFTKSGTMSPRTLGALIALHAALELHVRVNHRGILSYQIEGGRLETMKDRDGDQYIRTVSPKGDQCPLVISSSVPIEITDSIRNLFQEMLGDDKERPQP